jgi:hypothetical protein
MPRISADNNTLVANAAEGSSQPILVNTELVNENKLW